MTIRTACLVIGLVLTVPLARSGHAGEGIFPPVRAPLAPDFTLNEFSTGKPVRLREFLGKKVVMLVFWTTWSESNKTFLPFLQKTHEQYGSQGLQVLAVCIASPTEKELSAIQKFKSNYNLTFPILLDGDMKVATELYGLSGPVPQTILIDCKEMGRWSRVGEDSEPSVFAPAIEELLAASGCRP